MLVHASEGLCAETAVLAERGIRLAPLSRMPVDRRFASEPYLPEVPYPCLRTSPLGCALEALALADVPVLFRGAAGSGRRWLALTLHAMRFPSEPAVELDFGHRPPQVTDDALPIRALLADTASHRLIIHSLAAMSGSAQAALADALDSPRVSVLASADLGDYDSIGRSLLDRFLAVDAPALSLRHELHAIVEVFLEYHAIRGGVRTPCLQRHWLADLTAVGWPARLQQVDRVAQVAVGRGELRTVLQDELETLTAADPSEGPHGDRVALRLADDAGAGL